MSKPKIEYSETSWMVDLASMEDYATELESKNKALAKISDKQEQQIKKLEDDNKGLADHAAAWHTATYESEKEIKELEEREKYTRNNILGNEKALKFLRQTCKNFEEQIKELKFKLEDWQESHNIIINEECPSDEKHCTCVPALRKHIEQLEKKEKKNNEYNGANSSE